MAHAGAGGYPWRREDRAEPVIRGARRDRPFLFFIRDTKTNLVLFAGRVVDPTQ